MRDPKQSLDRRVVLGGVGAVGALAAVAVVVPGAQTAPPSQAAAAQLPPDTAAGYRLTEHVKRYYASTRI